MNKMEAPCDVIINDNGSLVLVTRSYLEKEKSLVLMEKLVKEVAWRDESVTLYGKKIMQPRRIYGCGDEGITHNYSGLSLPLEPWIPEIKELKDKISAELDLELNSCLLNYYRDGKDYIGWHSDKEIAEDSGVITISLGGSRDFYFKKKDCKVDTIKTMLHTGDLTLMYGNTQRDYTHSIPKRAHAEPRISLTFRKIK